MLQICYTVDCILQKIIATTYVYNNITACEMIAILIRICKPSLRFMDFICGKEVSSYSL